MSFWQRKTELNSTEYEELVKKFITLRMDMDKLSGKFDLLETNYQNLRGQFNRKLSGIAKEEKEADLGPAQPQNIKAFDPFNL